MIELRGVYKAFEGNPVLENLSFRFPPNSVTGVVGPSGCGKTTLLNLILGLHTPDAGEIVAPKNLRFGCVFQEDRLIEHMDAYRNVRLTAHRGAVSADIADALSALGLDPRSDEQVSKYSGGMRRRVAIARALLANPHILILDEPFKGLDAPTRRRAAQTILRLSPDSTTILVTHDPEELALMGVEGTLELR
jgi:NitT/TauT family transport system ATP-binding protein